MLGRHARRLRGRLPKSQLLILLSVLGPGIITAFGGNDASGIYGYSLAGALYQYRMLWVLVLLAVSLSVCQEMCARMGAVTGKGLADLIREEYGVKVTLFAMAALLVANYATTVSEFAGITAAIEVFASPSARWFLVPLVAAGVWLLVTRGNYARVTRVLLSASLIYIVYVASAFLARPSWGEALQQTVRPHGLRFDNAALFMVINLIGTTITPWGLFYIQSSVRDRGIRAEDYGYTRLDVLVGAFAAILTAFFIIVCCGATLYRPGHPPNFDDAGQVAAALRPVAGNLATLLFAIGLFNASCFGAITVPLSTAYAVTESLGWESGLGRRVREAPLFIGVFTFLIVISALTVLFGGKDLTFLIILPNIVGGVLLPIILVLMLRLINDKRLMGPYTNSRLYNGVAWITTVALILLSLALLAQTLVPGL